MLHVFSSLQYFGIQDALETLAYLSVFGSRKTFGLLYSSHNLDLSRTFSCVGFLSVIFLCLYKTGFLCFVFTGSYPRVYECEFLRVNIRNV